MLVCYIITQLIAKEEIAMYINDRLPDYMSTSIFIELESIPQIEKAVYEIVQTHEVLRTSFHTQAEEIEYLSEMK